MMMNYSRGHSEDDLEEKCKGLKFSHSVFLREVETSFIFYTLLSLEHRDDVCSFSITLTGTLERLFLRFSC